VAPIPNREFGRTRLVVPALGYGCTAVGDRAVSEDEAARLLNGAVDLGIRLLDTARSYGLSEERIGRHLACRRSEIVLSTKAGYGVAGYEDWTGPCVTAGIERALRLLRTEVIDIVHLHSCPLETLRRGEVTAALQGAREAGKIRVAAYSGDNEPLRWAVDSGLFGSVQTSYSLCDQAARANGSMERAAANGLGVIAKRPLANAPWRAEPPDPGDGAAAAYRSRWAALDVDLGGIPPGEAALRFAVHEPGVHSAIVGSSSLDHLQRNADAAARGPLPAGLVEALHAWFDAKGAGWGGMI
jgi:aryl-alcohol dehydrogenase-like predicted oxidoreductase